MLQPSEQNTYADIEAAYKCLKENYGAKQEDIILYGQSVGSGPTLDLAARLPQLRAVVLHSAILSGLRVMYPVKRTYWFDIYKVISWAKILTCFYVSLCSFYVRNLNVISHFVAEHRQNPVGDMCYSSHSCKYRLCDLATELGLSILFFRYLFSSSLKKNGLSDRLATQNPCSYFKIGYE